jgi:hypothetical protein
VNTTPAPSRTALRLHPAGHTEAPVRPRSRAGGEPLPAHLRQALEHLSGLDMSDARVHRDSALPALVGARAFAHGERIYLAPGADDALAHEAWHVVQQKQGRVGVTGWVNGLPLNDEVGLEAEAEAMGVEAGHLAEGEVMPAWHALGRAAVAAAVVQRSVTIQEAVQDENRNWWPKTFTSLMQKDLLEGINFWVGLDDYNVARLGAIVTDMMYEGYDFATWWDLKREILIREPGYAAVAVLEDIVKDNRNRYAKALKELETYVKNMNANLGLNAKRDATVREKKRLFAGLMLYDKASYCHKFSQTYLQRGMFRWLLGRSNAQVTVAPDGAMDDPNLSDDDKEAIAALLTEMTDHDPSPINCWEFVLYGLVKANFVDPTYIMWINRKGGGGLYRTVVPIMDYYFVGDTSTTIPDELNRDTPTNREKRVPNLDWWKNKDTFAIHPERTIPRGRLLIFGSGEHVAISTGEMRAIQDPDARAQYGGQGHEILEHDFGTEVPRYSTVEELGAGYRQTTMIVAPFPICAEGNEFTLTGDIPLSGTYLDDYVQEKEAEIERQSTLDIQLVRKKTEKLLASLSPQVKSPKSNANAEMGNDDPMAVSAASFFEDNDEDEYEMVKQQSEMNIENLTKQAKRRKEDVRKNAAAKKEEVARTVTIVLRYNANDPYGRRLTLP